MTYSRRTIRSSRFRHRTSMLAALAVGSLGLAACGGSSGQTSASAASSGSSGGAASSSNSGTSGTTTACGRRGGSLTVGLEADWHPIDPVLGGLAVDDGGVESAVYASLFGISPDGDIQPDLATGYTVSPDGLTYTIQLRQGVTFQDGTPFNASAVQFNFQRDLNPSHRAVFASYIAPVTSVTASSPYTVVLHLSTPYPALPSVLAGFAGMMVSPAAVQKEGSSFPQHPVGAGPFQLVSQVPGQSVTFKAFPNYWQKGFPCLDSLTFQSIPNGSSRIASLQSGTIQDAENIGYTEIQQLKGASGVNVVRIPGLGTVFTMLETQHAPLNNPTARQAVLYATNFAAINRALYNNLYTPVESSFPRASWAYPGSKVPGYPTYNLAKAKALVSQLGGLSFTFAIQSGSPQIQQLAEALASQWQQAGIHVTISAQDQVTLINNATNGNFQGMLFRWQGAFDPDLDVYQFFHSGASLNNVHLSDPTLDKLLDQARDSNSKQTRKQLYGQVAQRIAADAPYDYLYAADWWRAVSTKLHGVPSLGNNWFIATTAWLSK